MKKHSLENFVGAVLKCRNNETSRRLMISKCFRHIAFISVEASAAGSSAPYQLPEYRSLFSCFLLFSSSLIIITIMMVIIDIISSIVFVVWSLFERVRFVLHVHCWLGIVFLCANVWINDFIIFKTNLMHTDRLNVFLYTKNTWIQIRFLKLYKINMSQALSGW